MYGIGERVMNGNDLSIDFEGLSKSHSTIKLTIKSLGGSVRRPDVEKKIASDYSAKTQELGKYNLPTYAEHIKPVNQIYSAMRAEFARCTTDWNGKGGERLISNPMCDHITDYMNDKEMEALSILEEQLSTYDDYRERARDLYGDLFRDEDWPDADEIRARHRVELRYGVVPDPDQDVRAGMSPEQQDRIRASVRRQIAENVDSAKRDIADQMATVVKKMKESLEAYTGEKKNSFRDSLIGNVKDMVTVVSKLNPNDKEIESTLQDLMRDITHLNPDTLRNDEAKRKEAAKKAEAILNNIGSFGCYND
jgi:uncharacterized protein YukE